MLDGRNPVVQRSIDGFVGIEMRGNVGLGVPRLLDDGCEFVVGKAEERDGVCRRGHSAISHNLEEGRAAADHHEPRGGPHLLRRKIRPMAPNRFA